MPDNITKMLRDNYKKVAIINTSTKIDTLPPPSYGRAWRKWSLNLSFTPSIIIMIGTDDSHDESMKRPLTIVSNRDTEQKIHIYENINQNAFIGIRNITKDGFEYLFESYSGATSRIIQIIAIE